MKLSVKNKYLYENDKPFFWLGDTAWLILEKLTMDEIRLYLKNRAGLGYNVVQMVLAYSLPDLESNDVMASDVKNYSSYEYWSFVKDVVDYAKDLNIWCALLPSWGHYVKKGVLNENNAYRYSSFLANYFKKTENIIWVLGGDVRGDQNYECFNIMGNTFKKLDPLKLVTFHPFGRTGSYLWFNDCSWLDFNMFQSGHRRYDQLALGAWDDKNDNEDSFGEDSYKYVIKAHSYNIKKPVLDAEPSYEGIVQGLHDPHEPYWEARHIRRYAYWSVFEGACGFTYGNNAIIQLYRGYEKGSYGVRETWQEALHSPGGAQLQYLKRLMESVDFVNGHPHSEYVLNNKERHHRASVFAGDDYMLIYTYKGDKLDIDLSRYMNKNMDIYLMNPENDSLSYYGSVSNLDNITIRPTKRRELSNDWVIIFKQNR